MNIKMADFFKFPCQGLITGIDSRRCNTDNCDGVSEYDYVESAIDSYDANQALIAKQSEKIKMLREALEMFRPEIYYNQNGEEIYVGGKFTIYSDGDADSEAMQQVHEVLEATKEQA